MIFLATWKFILLDEHARILTPGGGVRLEMVSTVISLGMDRKFWDGCVCDRVKLHHDPLDG